jgi:catechol 2,3-dioxygenase
MPNMSPFPAGVVYLISDGQGRGEGCVDPDGHRLEIYTSDYYTGDSDRPVLRWSVLDPRRRDFWGNPVIPSWYSDASVVLDLDGKVRPVTELARAAEATVGADGFTAPAG